MTPSDEAANEQIDLASKSIERGTTKWPGMTYEQGVDAAIRWMLGEEDTAPMDE